LEQLQRVLRLLFNAEELLKILSIVLWVVEVRCLEVVKTKKVFPRLTKLWSHQHSCSIFKSPQFESWPGHRLSRLRLFMVFFSPSIAHQSSTSKQTPPLPSTSLPNNYSLNMLSFSDRANGSVVKKTDLCTYIESLRFRWILLLPPEGMNV